MSFDRSDPAYALRSKPISGGTSTFAPSRLARFFCSRYPGGRGSAVAVLCVDLRGLADGFFWAAAVAHEAEKAVPGLGVDGGDASDAIQVF